MVIYLGRASPRASSRQSWETPGKLNLPVRRCSGWGLQRPYVSIEAGELLPRLFTLTAGSIPRRYLSVALSLESPPQAVSLHPALRSSDFPHASKTDARNHLPRSIFDYLLYSLRIAIRSRKTPLPRISCILIRSVKILDKLEDRYLDHVFGLF